MRTCLLALCTVLLFVLPGHSRAQSLPTLEVIPAWQGLFRADKNTELQLRIKSAQTGPANLFISDSSINKQLRLQLTAGISKKLVIPVRLTNNNTITVQLDSPGQVSQKKTVWFDLTTRTNHIVAIATARPFTAEIDKALRLNVTAAMLPQRAQSYNMIDTLVIDAVTLTALSGNQLHALEEFLSNCGRLIMLAMPTEIVSAMTENAGCHGDNIKTIKNPAELTNSLHGFSKQTTGIDTNPGEFRKLADAALSNTRMLDTVISFFLLYLLALVITRLLTRRTEAVITLSVASSLLTALAWAGNNPEIRSYSWLEINSGDNSARYSFLLRQTGNGLGQNNISVPAYLHDPVSINSSAALTPPHLEVNDRNDATLVLPTALLSQTELYFNGTIAQDNSISLLNKDGVAHIINRGATAIEDAFLQWQGQLISLPVIQPQASWTSTAPQQTKNTKAPITLTEILNRHRNNYRHALFIQQPINLFAPALQDHVPLGWLVIHAERS